MTAAFSTFGTQIYLGMDEKDTSAWLAYDEIETAYNAKNQEDFAEGMGLLVSQILKFEADAASVDVAPTST